MEKSKKNTQSVKYQVPEELKERASNFIKDFMKAKNVNASRLAQMLKELDSNRSDSRTNILNKLARASFQLTEVMQILDLFDCELKIVSKNPIEGHTNSPQKP